MKSTPPTGTVDVETCHLESKLIDLSAVGDRPLRRCLLSLLKTPIEKLLLLDAINDLYVSFYNNAVKCKEPKEVFQACLDELNVTFSVSSKDLKKIPQQGPLVVVANHPFGGLEGVVLGRVLLEVRSDLKILANYLLKRLIGIGDAVIPVDPFGNQTSVAANLKGMKEAIRWLKDGGTMATFPAGEVSSFRLRNAQVADPEWAANIGGLIRRSKASVLPVYFPGRNSLWFQMLGKANPKLRTAMLPREVVNKMDSNVRVYIGKAIPWRKLKRLETDRELVDYLRVNTYFLRNRSLKKKRSIPVLPIPKSTPLVQEPIIAPVDPDLLENEIANLSAEYRLIQNGDLSVYIAKAHQIPNLLNEIGRLREVTFREVEEGTGNAVDLDRFDSYYLHLFLWNHRQHELVGAYRLGLSDLIIKKYGFKGLYTNQLFRFKPEFIQRLDNAIETGRSFVRSEYQRKFNSLVLLWRGIGEFIGRNPQYRILFGPVSISQDYHVVSKNLMIRFLKENNFDTSLSRFVKPRKPYRGRRVRGVNKSVLKASFQDIDDISVLISEIENDGKGVPILLRHYLKLNGNLISFNVDREFSSVVDGLLLVDLDKTETKLLKRFMGENGHTVFKKFRDKVPPMEPFSDYISKDTSP